MDGQRYETKLVADATAIVNNEQLIKMTIFTATVDVTLEFTFSAFKH